MQRCSTERARCTWRTRRCGVINELFTPPTRFLGPTLLLRSLPLSPVGARALLSLRRCKLSSREPTAINHLVAITNCPTILTKQSSLNSFHASAARGPPSPPPYHPDMPRVRESREYKTRLDSILFLFNPLS